MTEDYFEVLVMQSYCKNRNTELEMKVTHPLFLLFNTSVFFSVIQECKKGLLSFYIFIEPKSSGVFFLIVVQNQNDKLLYWIYAVTW